MTINLSSNEQKDPESENSPQDLQSIKQLEMHFQKKLKVRIINAKYWSATNMIETMLCYI